MLFIYILAAIIAALLIFYIALLTNDKLLNWFDDLIDPIRNYFDKEV